MRSFENIEKSAFRRFEYVGYGGGRVWRVRKTGFGVWEACATPHNIATGDGQSAGGYFRAKGLEGVSRKLAELGK